MAMEYFFTDYYSDELVGIVVLPNYVHFEIVGNLIRSIYCYKKAIRFFETAGLIFDSIEALGKYIQYRFDSYIEEEINDDSDDEGIIADDEQEPEQVNNNAYTFINPFDSSDVSYYGNLPNNVFWNMNENMECVGIYKHNSDIDINALGVEVENLILSNINNNYGFQ